MGNSIWHKGGTASNVYVGWLLKSLFLLKYKIGNEK